jgi:hypothetical protein
LVDFSAVLALNQPVSNFTFQTVHAILRRTAYRLPGRIKKNSEKSLDKRPKSSADCASFHMRHTARFPVALAYNWSIILPEEVG